MHSELEDSDIDNVLKTSKKCTNEIEKPLVKSISIDEITAGTEDSLPSKSRAAIQIYSPCMPLRG